MARQASRMRVIGPAFVVCVLAASCATGAPGPTTSPSDVPTRSVASSSPGPTLSSGSPSSAADLINGTFDVGGHSLYLKCKGSASPTVVYMHGSINERTVDPHSNGDAFITALSDERRVCIYDRRNLAHSDTVDAPQLPDDAMGDLHALLAAAGVEPPYVLLGASFGGILSYLQANTYPDEVVGMVLLDAMFPDELALDALFKPEDRIEAFDAEDENESLERISHYKAQVAAQAYIGKEPDIPVTYLASIPQGYEVNEYGIPEYDKKVIEAQKAYVARFTPGKHVRVDAPHFMEPAIPGDIVEALRDVIAAAGYQAETGRPAHLPIHASWLNQVEIYFSILERKVLTPADAASLDELAARILAFQDHYEVLAQPFEWKFTRADLTTLLERLSVRDASPVPKAA